MTKGHLDVVAHNFSLKEADVGAIMDQLHVYLKQAVTLHTSMFEKLLFQSDELPLELAELFESIANIYLDFSEIISERAFIRGKVKG